MAFQLGVPSFAQYETLCGSRLCFHARRTYQAVAPSIWNGIQSALSGTRRLGNTVRRRQRKINARTQFRRKLHHSNRLAVERLAQSIIPSRTTIHRRSERTVRIHCSSPRTQTRNRCLVRLLINQMVIFADYVNFSDFSADVKG